MISVWSLCVLILGICLLQWQIEFHYFLISKAMYTQRRLRKNKLVSTPSLETSNQLNWSCFQVLLSLTSHYPTYKTLCLHIQSWEMIKRKCNAKEMHFRVQNPWLSWCLGHLVSRSRLEHCPTPVPLKIKPLNSNWTVSKLKSTLPPPNCRLLSWDWSCHTPPVLVSEETEEVPGSNRALHRHHLKAGHENLHWQCAQYRSPIRYTNWITKLFTILYLKNKTKLFLHNQWDLPPKLLFH